MSYSKNAKNKGDQSGDQSFASVTNDAKTGNAKESPYHISRFSRFLRQLQSDAWLVFFLILFHTGDEPEVDNAIGIQVRILAQLKQTTLVLAIQPETCIETRHKRKLEHTHNEPLLGDGRRQMWRKSHVFEKR
jgi:hypothetical protein